MKATILSGFTAVLLGTTTGTAALAQDDARYGYGPPESTPAEMQQTGQLNQQSGDAAAADLATRARNDAQYQDQMQQYHQQLQYSQTQQQSYDVQRQRYYDDRARYYAAWPPPYGWGYGWGPYGWGYPVGWGYPYAPGYPYGPDYPAGAYPAGPAYPPAPGYNP